VNDPKAQQWLTRPGGLATRLKQIRGDRSGLSLAKSLDWQSSKITRIEQGEQVPSADDIAKWASKCGAGEEVIAELLELLADFKSVRGVLKQRSRQGETPAQTDTTALVGAATLIQWYAIAAIPGILQLPDYARAVFEEGFRTTGDDPDLDEAVDDRMRRQSLLYDRTRRFEILLDEPVLYRMRGSVDVMRAQLDRLLPVGGMPNVKFGIIPIGAFTAVPAAQGFVIYDDAAFLQSHKGEEPVGPGGAEFYGQLMVRLWEHAVTGDAARKLILKAIDSLPER
jgi:hypothetical protein